MTMEKKKMKKIKKFNGLCNTDQDELKMKLENILGSFGYKNIVNEDGFLYAKGELPVLLVAHMDTVHKFLPGFIKIETREKDGKTILSSPYGIGGDDRCGVYMILEIVKTHKCSVLFCEDEESGCIGSGLFAKSKYINELNVNYMIELDRKGRNDAVFYECDNPDFEEFVTEDGFFETDFGSYTDICELMPKSKIAGVNLSCGYYEQHTKNEYVVFEEMLELIEETKKLIDKPVEKPFEFIEREHSYRGYYGGYYGNYGYGDGWYDDYDGWGWKYNYKETKNYTSNNGVLRSLDEPDVKLWCVYYFYEGDYEFTILKGETEEEITLDFLRCYDDIPYKNIIKIYNEKEMEFMGLY